MAVTGRLANVKTRRETGLDYVVAALEVLTPFGKSLIREQKPYFPGQEEELREELTRIETLVKLAGERVKDIGMLQECFMMIKDNSLTIERSEKSTLTTVEIFELKSLLLLMGKIRKLTLEGGFPKEFVPEDTEELLDILDPGGERLNTFYIYDSFSERLALLRKEKKELETAVRREQKLRKKEIKENFGIVLTPKFDITVSKSDDRRIKMIEEISDLRRSDEDYMSVTYVLAPTEEVNALIKKKDIILAEIEDEEYKVREILSKEIAARGRLLLENCETIGRFDVSLAKAVFARTRRCVKPEIVQEHIVEFENGRHLQVEQIVERKGGAYCPVSISLRDGVTCITGANMGGKTVSLKLVGMVAVLAQYGYFVPCDSARVGLSSFMQILIGDSQSIERGLSSFGSEMEELKEIMDNARDRSLILVDEIASGTNPVEGLALTRSIVDYLKTREYISLITTHFEQVTEDEDVVNMQVRGLAEVDFDMLNREIRYAGRKERIGIIQSHMDYRLVRVGSGGEIPKDALNIAKMLGIDREIIENAKKYIN